MTQNSIQVFKPKIREEAVEAVAEVLRSGWIGQGPKVKELEERFSEYIGCNHAIALNSCTAALHMALVLANVKPGQVVFTTALTFVSTNLAIKYVGAKPHFIDSYVDGNMAPFHLRDALEQYKPEEIGAVVVVHWSGYPAHIDSIKSYLEHKTGRKDIPVIEDCAHACGAEVNGVKVGAEADIACFSFQAVKNLPAGDGGMLTTNDPMIAERARRLAWCGINKSTFSRTAATGEYLWQYDVPEVGFKYHMNDITAAIALEQLKYLDEDNARRAEIAQMYKDGLMRPRRHPLCLGPMLQDDKGYKSSFHFLPFLFHQRDKVLMGLREKGINCGVHYMLNSKFEPFKDCPYEGAGQDAVYEKHLLTLPMHMHLTNEDVAYVIKSVWEVCDEIVASENS